MIKEYLIKLEINLEWLPYLEKCFSKYSITDEYDIKMFLAQTSHESKNFTVLKESFKYSPKRLLEVFPSKVKTLENAENICSQGWKSIAELVYGNRKDLGNINAGDGYKFIGRGIIQLTGRNNYSKYSKLTGLDLINNPDLLLEKDAASEVACCYYKNRGLIGIRDIKEITKKINGGYNGLQDRIRRFELIKDI
ncbi:glycoside hydrolase family 19 protein [Brachyspira intermedia]|uniref:glycoside hydrolase family 19 protein n=1 Tax=Brachyspira intermedia TaxID=84377 RepID=UPI0030064164